MDLVGERRLQYEIFCGRLPMQQKGLTELHCVRLTRKRTGGQETHREAVLRMVPSAQVSSFFGCNEGLLEGSCRVLVVAFPPISGLGGPLQILSGSLRFWAVGEKRPMFSAGEGMPAETPYPLKESQRTSCAKDNLLMSLAV